jgi:hypothetical protein
VTASAAYPIIQNGEATGFYIAPHINTNNFTDWAPTAGCEVFEGMPGAGGIVQPDDSSPFSCDMHKHVFSNDWDFTIRTAGH